MKSRRRKVSEDKRSKGIRNSMPIPVDLIIDIFSRLPAKSIARCRCVSKRWASILGRPEFTELFFTRSSALPQLLFSSGENGELSFFSAPQDPENSSPIPVNHLMKFPSAGFYTYWGSVRGLVCVSLDMDRSCERVTMICNPSTGQSLPLPSVKTKKKPRSVFTVFGYDPIQQLYKVLCILADDVAEEQYVLTLGPGKLSWRKIDCCVPHWPGFSEICINGLLYYIAAVDSFTMSSMLVCFDFTTEKFKVIKATGLTVLAGTLVNYNGKLASLSSEDSNFIYGTSKSFEMRILEDPEKHAWSKHVYELPPQWQNILGGTVLSFAGVTGTNEIVLSQVSDCPFYVVYYNIERKTIRTVEIQEIDAFRHSRVQTFADHVEDVKLMEMFRTYNLRSCNRS